MNRLWVDLETFSEVPINHGTHAYAAGASIMVFAYAIDDGPVKVWDVLNDSLQWTDDLVGELQVVEARTMPADLRDALCDQAVLIYAHNSHFDRTVMRHAGSVVERAAAQNVERWRDTMVQALTHGLPGSLGSLCDILQVPQDEAKDKAGRQFIHLFCKPRPAGSKARRATRHTHPAEWARFVEYAGLDISAMRAINRKLPEWNYRAAELALWHLDQRVNDRGVAVDRELATAAVAAVATAQKMLADRTQEITAGDVASTTQRDVLLGHILFEYGVDLPDLQMATLERRITDPDLPIELRELLGIRLQASTSSTSKYGSLVRGTSEDGRLRGLLQYSGAQRTRRWAGRLFQPQNLPRPSLDQDVIDLGIEALKDGCADLITDNVMELTSSAIRGCLVAGKGKKLVVSDLANIEGRCAAWLAGETWKLQAFRDYDEGTGPDLYRLAYAKAFVMQPGAVQKDQRQVGKVMELMLQYEGGVGAFLTGAATYGIDLDDLAEKAWPTLPAWARDEATEFLAWSKSKKRNTYGLAEKTFIVCDALKRMWRAAHQRIALLWKELDGQAVFATQWPGQKCKAGPFVLRRDGAWLRILLPSGNYLCYPSPECKGDKLTYMGVNQYTRKWARLGTYGGKLFENACQSLARDVMAHNMPAIEQAGYSIVLTVHDEVITEAPDTSAFTSEGLCGLLATNPPWALDMPLAAGGFEAYRYRKE